jgi:hypothetical protein
MRADMASEYNEKHASVSYDSSLVSPLRSLMRVRNACVCVSDGQRVSGRECVQHVRLCYEYYDHVSHTNTNH